MNTSEQNVVDLLSDWLFAWGLNVYQNHENDKYRVFHISGESTKKPDLFICSKQNPAWWRCVIEVKKPWKVRDVLNAKKIIGYMNNWSEGKTVYRDDNWEELVPKYFLVATNQSMYGKLLDQDIHEQPIKSGGGLERAISYGVCPKREYAQTFMFIRDLWAQWKDRDIAVSLGLLLSDILDGGVGMPAIFSTRYSNNNNRWGSYWMKWGGQYGI